MNVLDRAKQRMLEEDAAGNDYNVGYWAAYIDGAMAQKREDEKSVVSEMKIKKVTETAVVPKIQTDGAAGCDLFADIQEPVVVKPHETVMVMSGIAMQIPKGYFGAIYARSGISIKEGLRPATCVSVIDSDYRGNIGLPIHNDSEENRIINPGERVAQMVFHKYERFTFKVVEKLEETDRGENGFGSTGV